MSCFHFDMAHSKKSPSQDSRDAQDAAKDLDGKKIAGKEVHHGKRRCNMIRKTEGWQFPVWKKFGSDTYDTFSGVGSARQRSQENDQHQCCCCAVLTQM